MQNRGLRPRQLHDLRRRNDVLRHWHPLLHRTRNRKPRKIRPGGRHLGMRRAPLRHALRPLPLPRLLPRRSHRENQKGTLPVPRRRLEKHLHRSQAAHRADAPHGPARARHRRTSARKPVDQELEQARRRQPRPHHPQLKPHPQGLRREDPAGRRRRGARGVGRGEAGEVGVGGEGAGDEEGGELYYAEGSADVGGNQFVGRGGGGGDAVEGHGGGRGGQGDYYGCYRRWRDYVGVNGRAATRHRMGDGYRD
mmetsp:Transcript_20450/g.50481  ORF Transcript_20450/g.50481 Transcript_20450/m.50481 type:complete len:252 (+) Transcript_20450:428-1183(+)